jgi:hypothetical protein
LSRYLFKYRVQFITSFFQFISTLGAVPAAVRVLATDAGSPSQALPILEAAVGCAKGRAAIREKADAAVPTVLSKMMKGGMGSAEAGVSVL